MPPELGESISFVGLAQLTDELAWHYKRFENEQTAEERGRYAFAEDEALVRRAGLWKDTKLVPPWEWRPGERAQ
jgi:endonuclease YncB( thermonuclease family)